MQHRKRTALIAGLFTITCLAQISMNTMSGISADAAGSYDMAVTVNLAGEKKAISPYIYGVNDSGDGSNLKMSRWMPFGRAATDLPDTTGKPTTPTPEKTGTTALIPISEMTQTAMAMPAEDCLQLARKTAIRIN